MRFGLLGCLIYAPWAQAQIDQGSFLGRVTDPSGGIVANATVHALNVGTNVVADTTTNETGFFEFPLLPVGRYVITVEKGGFRKAATAQIELHAGTKPRVDVTLQVGEVTEAVTVTSETPLVNATSTELGTVIDERKVEELPLNGRNFAQLFSLQNGYNLGGQSARGVSAGGVHMLEPEGERAQRRDSARNPDHRGGAIGPA